MADIVVQPLEEKYLEGFHTVRSLTYNNGDPIPEERRVMDSPGTRSFIARVGDEVCGVCTILEMTATRGPALLKSAGVAGVAVLPELRKSGVGSAMMSWLVSHLRESGIPLASLYAYREPFYRKFGYEVVGRRLKITCPTHRWPRIESDLPVRRLKPSDWMLLHECYRKFSHTRSGLNMRNEYLWQRVLGENRQLTIYAVGDPVEAYAVVSHQSSFWTTDHLSEVAWSSRGGYEGLISMLGGLAINKSGLSWFEPSDGPYYTRFLDAGVDVKVDRPVMFRVTDVPAALSQLILDPSISGTFSIEIQDSIEPANIGSWKVEYFDGKVEVQRDYRSRPADLSMGIHAFTQAFMGEPGLTQLQANELIDVRSHEGLRHAKIIMPDMATCCMDFF